MKIFKQVNCPGQFSDSWHILPFNPYDEQKAPGVPANKCNVDEILLKVWIDGLISLFFYVGRYTYCQLHQNSKAIGWFLMSILKIGQSMLTDFHLLWIVAVEA